MAKKVLAVSFGKKMGYDEVLAKRALMECERAGCEVRFIRANDLDIHICTGCISCVVGLVSGRGRGDCVLKDEFHVLDEAILESDAVIVACPTYETSPTGRFKTVCDRIGPSHDISFRKTAYEEGKAAGKPEAELPDPRTWKKRVGVLITTGGAMTQNWVAMTIPTMFEFTFPLGIDVIDTFEYYGGMAFNHVLGDENAMERSAEMGRRVAEALAAESEEEMTRWRGEDKGVCPVCHCQLLRVSDDNSYVECAVCGIRGELTLRDGKIAVAFSEKERERSRLKWGGKLEHSTEIKTRTAAPGQIPDLAERKRPYMGYAEDTV